MGVRTVQRWLRQPDGTTNQPQRKRRSIFDPYAPYVLSRWQQGCRESRFIFQEIQKQGFKGSIRTVYRFIHTLRQGPVELPAPSVLDRVSVQEALWLIVRPFDDLELDERRNLLELCQTRSQLSMLHPLVQAFGQIVRKREGHRLEDWKQHVAESGISEVQRFVAGLERDQEAVLAGLTLVYSNGQVEGQVNKLKLLKRTMYGRAGFPLLRQRVLHAL
ncbi:transposase [Ktedonospora formicarum]|uniref:transposase n=1 Tax=Ktedonospora formicarum TaxID=2778364 RepID=UPI003B75BFD0